MAGSGAASFILTLPRVGGVFISAVTSTEMFPALASAQPRSQRWPATSASSLTIGSNGFGIMPATDR